MSCDRPTLDGYLRNFEPWDAIYCPLTDVLGGDGVILGLLVAGTLGLMMVSYAGSMALPVVVLMLVGSVIVASLPAGALQIVGSALLLVIAGALYALIRRLQK